MNYGRAQSFRPDGIWDQSVLCQLEYEFEILPEGGQESGIKKGVQDQSHRNHNGFLYENRPLRLRPIYLKNSKQELRQFAIPVPSGHSDGVSAGGPL